MRSASWRRQATAGYLFALPGLLFFAVFLVYPLAKAFQISLHNWSIMPGKISPFVGVGNYARAVRDPIFWLAMRNTLAYTVLTVPGQMAVAMAAALLLDQIRRGRVFFRTAYYLPAITSWVVVSLVFKYLFISPHGVVNYVFTEVLPLLPREVGWLTNPITAMVPVVMLGIWKGIGWSMIIFLAGLQGVSRELYEAASIDGAGRWQRFSRITLPFLRPIVLFDLVMLSIGGFNVFPSVFLITGGGPLRRTEVMLTYMYHQAFDFREFGYGAALSFLLATAIVVVSVLQFRYMRHPIEINA